LKKRSTRIKQLVEDIIAHQDYERQKEQKYTEHLESLNSGFKFVVFLQIGALVGAAIFSVVSLRKFFVKKNIY
jgi:emp24/gp25L/p24 family/GOLD